MQEEVALSIVNTEGLALLGIGSEWFWSMLQFLVVAVTLIGIYVQLRQDRAANAFAQANALSQEWDGERLVRRRLAIGLALLEHGADADLSALADPVGNFWEGTSALVRAGHVELAVILPALGRPCRVWWTYLEPEVRRQQATVASDIWENFEWLTLEVRRHDLARGVPDTAYSMERLLAKLPEGISGLRASIAEIEAMRTVTFSGDRAPHASSAPTPQAEASPARDGSRE